MSHDLTLRVYYEDTDLAGIVYYANYLKYIERGRSEWLRALGIDQQAMHRDSGHVFAVRRVEADYLRPAREADYLRPARFDDLLTVSTELAQASPARLRVDQQVQRDGQLLFAARVTIACLDRQGRAVRLPSVLRTAIDG